MGNESFRRGRRRNTPPDAALAQLASRQHGVVTSVQLRALGFSSSAVSKRCAAGRLHRVHAQVYAVGHRALSQETRWMAAVLVAGEGSALAGLAAAQLWRAWRRAVPHIDVVSPHRRRSRRGVRIHGCRNLDPRDVTRWRGIPVTTVARTLVDLTEELTAYQLANVIHEAAYRNRFNEAATREAMARANGRHRLGVLDNALALHNGGSAGTKSDLEDEFLARVHASGLPEPLVNVPVEVDFHWPGLGLCVEVDGPGHRRPRTQAEDRARDARLHAKGLKVVRVEPRGRPP